MKKIFTLIAMLVCMVSSMYAAGEIFTISFNGSNEQSQEGYFSWNTAKHNFNSKFVGTYNGVEYTKGLKMEGATHIAWKSEATSTVTIVQSTWSAKTNKLDGTELAVEDAVEDASNGVRVYTITNVPAGEHKITRGSGENGLFFIQVEYTGVAMTTLDAPAITANTKTGEVAIGAVENAKEIRYTLDGTDPGAENGEVYSAPFTVADGTVVKAIAIGDGTSFVSSDITTVQVLIEGTTPISPVIAQQYGSVAITCATPAVTIEYSTDNSTWTTYTRSFTLSSDATVYARASRGGVTSEVSSVEVKTVAQPTANTLKTLYICFDMFTAGSATNIIEGNNGTDAAGFVMTCANESKSYAEGAMITADEYVTFKASNGAQNILTIPEGKKVVRATIYSYVNAPSAAARTSGWREVAGVEYDVNAVPNGAFTDIEDHKTNPDVRVYPVECTGTFTFTNTGEQHAFFLELDVCDANDDSLVTGISEITTENNTNTVVYNLAGQKVSKNFKGIVIMNGKKFMQK